MQLKFELIDVEYNKIQCQTSNCLDDVMSFSFCFMLFMSIVLYLNASILDDVANFLVGLCFLRVQVSFLLGVIPVFVTWIYSEYLEYKKTSSPTKV